MEVAQLTGFTEQDVANALTPVNNYLREYVGISHLTASRVIVLPDPEEELERLTTGRPRFALPPGAVTYSEFSRALARLAPAHRSAVRSIYLVRGNVSETAHHIGESEDHVKRALSFFLNELQPSVLYSGLHSSNIYLVPDAFAPYFQRPGR